MVLLQDAAQDVISHLAEGGVSSLREAEAHPALHAAALAKLKPSPLMRKLIRGMYGSDPAVAPGVSTVLQSLGPATQDEDFWQ